MDEDSSITSIESGTTSVQTSSSITSTEAVSTGTTSIERISTPPGDVSRPTSGTSSSAETVKYTDLPHPYSHNCLLAQTYWREKTAAVKEFVRRTRGEDRARKFETQVKWVGKTDWMDKERVNGSWRV
jgi:hypothetical protein